MVIVIKIPEMLVFKPPSGISNKQTVWPLLPTLFWLHQQVDCLDFPLLPSPRIPWILLLTLAPGDRVVQHDTAQRAEGLGL